MCQLVYRQTDSRRAKPYHTGNDNNQHRNGNQTEAWQRLNQSTSESTNQKQDCDAMPDGKNGPPGRNDRNLSSDRPLRITSQADHPFVALFLILSWQSSPAAI